MHVKLNENVLLGAVSTGRKRVLELPPEELEYGRSAKMLGVLLTVAFAGIAYYVWPLLRWMLP